MREASTAPQPTDSTPLGAKVSQVVREHPGESAFYVLNSGVEAFAARIALIESAQETIDLQYYIFHADESGKAIIARLLAAADRGVRVRILIDDIYATKADANIAVLELHPKIEIRLFNPWKYRGGGFAQAFNFLTDSARLNHRMHNKMFAADNAAMVMGGRNLGDEYFNLNEEFIFSDLDVLAVGPVTAEASQYFDRYWNSEWAVPTTARKDLRPSADDLDRFRVELAAHMEAIRASPFGVNAANSEFIRQVRAHQLAWVFAPATVLADDPDKVVSNRKKDRDQFLLAQLGRAAPRADQELLLCSPYFVPGKEGVHYLESRSTNGVNVRILTNSQEANDVSSVHSGYAPYRAELLRAGVQLYEFRRTADPWKKSYDARRFGSANASLHTKCFIADRHRVFVGSLNLDPRSIQRNTETGILIESPEIGQQLAQLFERGTSLVASYEVVLRDGPNSDSSDLAWITSENGEILRFETEPGTTWFQRFKVKLMGILPIESQL